MVGVTDVSFNDCDDIYEGVFSEIFKVTLHIMIIITVMKTKSLFLHT